MIGFSFSWYYIINLSLEFFTYDIVTSSKHRHSNNLTFPALTICSYYQLTKEIDNYIIECKFNDEPCELNRIESIKVSGDKQLWCFRFNGVRTDDSRSPLKSSRAGYKGGLDLSLYMPWTFFYYFSDNSVMPVESNINGVLKYVL